MTKWLVLLPSGNTTPLVLPRAARYDYPVLPALSEKVRKMWPTNALDIQLMCIDARGELAQDMAISEAREWHIEQLVRWG